MHIPVAKTERQICSVGSNLGSAAASRLPRLGQFDCRAFVGEFRCAPRIAKLALSEHPDLVEVFDRDAFRNKLSAILREV